MGQDWSCIPEIVVRKDNTSGNPRSDLNTALIKSLEHWKWLIQTWSTATDHVSPSSESGCSHFH